MGWVFQGSPEKFDVDDYLSRYPELIYWRTPRHAGDIKVGDRAFVWRAGTDSGAIAIGTVVESPTPPTHVQHPEALGDDLWIAERPDPTELKTGLHLEEIRLTPHEGMVARLIVKADPALASTTIIRMPTGTVFRLSIAETNALEELWGANSSNRLPAAEPHAEGARRLRAHQMRERSPRLRSDKLRVFRQQNGGLFCEICGETGTARYPASCADRIFEVHHRAPLALAATPVRTTLSDLAVLCANCHRSVHATPDVEANFETLADFFQGRS